ncbi:WGxxGxxG family protein [Prauserella oleivorans]|uniref:WGxxGxxG family protein n=1 Tax=Prauserella oleivorans TaxID=1478153 RepID=A0ABW5W616_9PSEU
MVTRTRQWLAAIAAGAALPLVSVTVADAGSAAEQDTRPAAAQQQLPNGERQVEDDDNAGLWGLLGLLGLAGLAGLARRRPTPQQPSVASAPPVARQAAGAAPQPAAGAPRPGTHLVHTAPTDRTAAPREAGARPRHSREA